MITPYERYMARAGFTKEKPSQLDEAKKSNSAAYEKANAILGDIRDLLPPADSRGLPAYVKKAAKDPIIKKEFPQIAKLDKLVSELQSLSKEIEKLYWKTDDMIGD